ncbi:CMGC/SRPK protein kinase [Fusarium proliferatum]|uniref:non-specific serine/threonine protein kinase n=1 Tax=Gibberella intermedia TaxID=948311 RepID=A0A365NGJ5_GIBIN|nr:CMGC/SRPK protein kinase [Fusarium proliferatum]
MLAQRYRCSVDAEPLHRYEAGGYHPLALGDVLEGGRYKILHKLGWGSYSTTWAAKDQKDDLYVALKVTISEAKESRELKVLQALSSQPNNHPGWHYVNKMLDHFTILGPNGSHDCLVLELVGPNVADVVERHLKDSRLPSNAARLFSKQILQGLDFLSASDIGHGDVHTRNLALTTPDLHSLSEKDFMAKLGEPDEGLVLGPDDAPLPKSLPARIVRPASFGHREIFELITGQPPFDVIMLTPPILVEQMIELIDDELPSRWQAKWQAMQGTPTQPDDDGMKLHSWLEEVYFDSNKKPEFTKYDIKRAAELIARLMRFEPSLRATPNEILAESWL